MSYSYYSFQNQLLQIYEDQKKDMEEKQTLTNGMNNLREGLAANNNLTNHPADFALAFKGVLAAGVFYYGVKWSWKCAVKVVSWWP